MLGDIFHALVAHLDVVLCDHGSQNIAPGESFMNSFPTSVSTLTLKGGLNQVIPDIILIEKGRHKSSHYIRIIWYYGMLTVKGPITQYILIYHVTICILIIFFMSLKSPTLMVLTTY